MPIDWFTVVAQAINFLILVWLLKRFLYGPIVQAMTERENRIAERYNEAKDRRAEAETERERLERERSELKERREELLEEAREQAEQKRSEIVAEARSEAERLERRWRRELEKKRDRVIEAIADRSVELVASAVRRSLEDLADESLNNASIRAFLRRLGDLDEDEREALAESLRESEVELRLAAEPDEELRERLVQAVREIGGGSSEPRVEIDENLVSGVELRASGRRIDWSLRRCLQDLEREMREALEREAPSVDESESRSGESTSKPAREASRAE